jgi:transposase
MEMLECFKEQGVTHAAMEATGDYWTPIYNLLEGHFELIVANAAHMKAVPGRETDVQDAEWIADLLRHGLLRASFIPSRQQRDLRELTRHRSSLAAKRGQAANELHKALESANIKLQSVVTDITGVSATEMLQEMVGEIPTPKSWHNWPNASCVPKSRNSRRPSAVTCAATAKSLSTIAGRHRTLRPSDCRVRRAHRSCAKTMTTLIAWMALRASIGG